MQPDLYLSLGGKTVLKLDEDMIVESDMEGVQIYHISMTELARKLREVGYKLVVEL